MPAHTLSRSRFEKATGIQGGPTKITFAFVTDRPNAKDGADASAFDTRERLDIEQQPGARSILIAFDATGDNLAVDLSFDGAAGKHYLVYRLDYDAFGNTSSDNNRYIDISGGIPDGSALLVQLHNDGPIGEVVNPADNCPASPDGQQSTFAIHVKTFDYKDHGKIDHVFYGYVDASVDDHAAPSASWSDASGNPVREGDFLNSHSLSFSETDGTSGSEVFAPGIVWVPAGKKLIYRIEYVKCDGTRVKDPAVYVQSAES
jgi:hypothetical protein